MLVQINQLFGLTVRDSAPRQKGMSSHKCHIVKTALELAVHSGRQYFIHCKTMVLTDVLLDGPSK